MKNTMDKIMDKMIEISEKRIMGKIKFKVRTVKDNVIELHKFGEFSAIKNRIESEEMAILYDDKIYSVDDFLNL